MRTKIFLWLLTLALALMCLTGWAMSELVLRSLRDTPRRALPVPYFTRLVVIPDWWLLVVPLFGVASSAILSFRREVTPPAALLFAGIIILVAVLLACALTIALTIPYIPRHG